MQNPESLQSVLNAISEEAEKIVNYMNENSIDIPYIDEKVLLIESLARYGFDVRNNIEKQQ